MRALGLRRGQGIWNGALLNTTTGRWSAGTTILLSSQQSHLMIHSGIAVPGRAQWLRCTIDSKVIGLLNIYAPNSSPDQANFWRQLASNLPTAESWIVVEDLNMVETTKDRSSQAHQNLTREEQTEWERFILKYRLEDVWKSDDFTHYNSLAFSWSNKQQGTAYRKARLDRFYTREWGKISRGQTKIMEGYT